MSRGRKRKKNTFWWKVLLFILILIAAAIFLGRSQEEKAKETVWQDGSMLRIGDLQVDAREGMVYLDAVQADYEQYYGSDIWNYVVDSQGNTMEDSRRSPSEAPQAPC